MTTSRSISVKAPKHTIDFEAGPLRIILNVAIKWGSLKDNPKLLEVSPPGLCPIIYFTFLNSGMRKAELENVEWADVDFKRRKIKIRRKEDWQP